MFEQGNNSRRLFERALERIPGGVNSPVRAFKSVGGKPLFISRAKGAFIYDADGREFVDYVGSWGPMILGHCADVTIEALRSSLDRGISYGAPTELEVEMAEFLANSIPALEMVRMVNSGTEAVMSAVRLARGFTGRRFIVKCNGCYHGHADTLLVKAGSGVATLGIAGSPGIPEQIAQLTLSVEFNDFQLLKRSIESVGPENVAAVVVEPVPGNMGLVIPVEGYLSSLRDYCTQHGIVLIFDEVMSGFRVAFGGAAERFGVRPDLLTLGKVIGGGLPVGAFGGRRDIMSYLAPAGPVYQAGTLSGNPLAMAAGLATLRHLRTLNPYPTLEERAKRLTHALRATGETFGVPLSVASCGSMFGLFFADKPVTNFAEATASNVSLYNKFFHAMLSEGIYLAPSAFEAGFLSVCHTEDIIDRTLGAAHRAFSKLL